VSDQIPKIINSRLRDNILPLFSHPARSNVKESRGYEYSRNFRFSPPGEKFMNVLVLNSAHGKYPVGSEGWIQATRTAVRDLAASGEVFICSTEPIPWDLTACLAGASGSRIILIVKTAAGEHGSREFARIRDDLSLSPDRTEPLFLDDSYSLTPAHPKDLWQVRDRIALNVADAIYPVSIRPGGRLENLMREPSFVEKIRSGHRIPWTPLGYIPRYTLTGRPWRPLPLGEWLIHWTRACQGKWPGETTGDFFRDLLKDDTVYVRSAAETLARIVTEGRIRGSAWKVRGGAPVAAFTSLSPGDAVELMRWRKRYVRFSFEPYGIAVRKEELVKNGAGEVRYARNGEGPYEPDLFLHAPGEGDRWAREREWRIAGDFDLRSIPEGAALAVVPDDDAARDIRPGIPSGFPVHVLFR
jgi:hypothetical protein